MVLDDHDRGRPVAFMISKHVNEDAIQYFFEVVAYCSFMNYDNNPGSEESGSEL